MTRFVKTRECVSWRYMPYALRCEPRISWQHWNESLHFFHFAFHLISSSWCYNHARNEHIGVNRSEQTIAALGASTPTSLVFFDCFLLFPGRLAQVSVSKRCPCSLSSVRDVQLRGSSYFPPVINKQT